MTTPADPIDPILVDAPGRRTYEYWIQTRGLNPALFHFIESAGDLRDSPLAQVIVLNGGSSDPQVRDLVRHPSRLGRVTWIWV